MRSTPSTTFTGELSSPHHRTTCLQIKAALRQREPVQGRSTLWTDEAPTVRNGSAETPHSDWVVAGWPWSGDDGSAESLLYAAVHTETGAWFLGQGLTAFIQRVHPEHRRPESARRRYAAPIDREDRDDIRTRMVEGRFFLEFFGTWSRREIDPVVVAVSLNEAVPSPTLCVDSPDAPHPGSEALRRMGRSAPFPLGHKWVCLRVQAADETDPYYHVRRWTRRTPSVSARSIRDLAAQVRDLGASVRDLGAGA